jgi:hypothetical protein
MHGYGVSLDKNGVALAEYKHDKIETVQGVLTRTWSRS